MIKATSKHKQLVVDILVSAFKDVEEENSINFLVGDGEGRIKRMQYLMGYLFDCSMLFGEVYLTDNLKSCLLLSFSENERVTFKSIYLDLKVLFQCIGVQNSFELYRRQKIIKQHYPKKENYIKPVIMGSLNDAYGSGSAARLVISVMKKYKENKKPVIVDTVSEYNINLYKKFGFKVIKIEESLGFPITLLRLN